MTEPPLSASFAALQKWKEIGELSLYKQINFNELAI
jgi:hypothetical protein